MHIPIVTPRDVAALCAALAHSRRGMIAVQTAILLVVLLGFVSFAVDIGSMLWQRRAMQSAADSGAWGAWGLDQRWDGEVPTRSLIRPAWGLRRPGDPPPGSALPAAFPSWPPFSYARVAVP